jgi:hypothetical protein
VTEEIGEEIKKFLESNEKENTIYQNLWNRAKDVLREKFRAISSYTRKNRALSNKLIALADYIP